MKITHTIHKKTSIFPYELVWMIKVSHTAGSVMITSRETIDVFDEEELWEFKMIIETGDYFLYWVTDWDALKRSLDES